MTDFQELTDTQVLWRLVNVATSQANNAAPGSVIKAFLDLDVALQQRLLHLSLADGGSLHGDLLRSVNLYSTRVEAGWDQHPGPFSRETDRYSDWIWVDIAQSPELRQQARGARAEYHDEFKSWDFPDESIPFSDPAAIAASMLQDLAWWPYFVRTHERLALSLQDFVQELRSNS